MNKAGLFVHSRWDAAIRLADRVRALLSDRVGEVWQTSDWDDSAVAESIPGTDLLICLGGDGTVLRAARVIVPHPLPILGVNMGRLGFLTEVRPSELIERLADVLEGRYRIEERTMLQAQVPSWGATHHALNDVVVGRASIGRPLYVEVSIDGVRLAVHRCDAVIAATATGSTAYSLSAGGPILHPESNELLLTPVAPHLGSARPLVLPPDAVIDLTVTADKEAVVSVDGQVDRTLASGDSVSVCRSAHTARFVRFSKPQDYYAVLAEKLDWLRVLQASDNPELFEFNGISTPK
ncbi:MAG TPA: NAD(+)/NADH kinase [Dehalococcoidia bacterium]|nr:NAD(+)/NADH kinase [Dehalococcoidia bacterium]